MRLWIGTRKGLFIVAGDRVVEHYFSGVPVTSMLIEPDTQFVALNHGHFGQKLHRRRREGAWEEIASPSLESRKDEGKAVSQLWSLARDRAGRLWCGTIPGALFSSVDHGEHWSLNAPLWDHPTREKWFGGGYDDPGIHSVAPHPSDGQRLWVAISCGGVWETVDGGASWEPRTRGMVAPYVPPEQAEAPEIQDPHLLVVSPSDPDVLWVQHHGGAYVSSDGAQRWRSLDVPPSSFGFPVATHPHNPGTAWFVPAHSDEMRVPVDSAMVVARTDDGGETFRVQRTGLPQRDCYDLVFRHALAVDESGDRLAMGSTTGNLWTTQDGGEQWALTLAHLPPIYCVTIEG